jgi:uncharacterized protein with LGFP repeats
VSSLDEATRPRGAAGLVHRLSSVLGGRVRRRDVFVGAAVAGSALATDPKSFALLPQTAYATICGPGNTASSGWTVFCCTINNGVNACPPGSFAAGWWKAADSSWCGGGYRYIVDCNAQCTKCSTGCSDGICDSRCWNCSCGTGSTATCDQRRVCCNAFRYGQCNTQVKCSGGVHCRVVTCTPPYTWTNCTTTSLRDDRTAEHSAPCIPQWGPIEQKYTQMGGPKSYLKASLGPIRTMPDGRGTYVFYYGGIIYYTSTTGAHPMTKGIYDSYAKAGGPLGKLGYPTADPTWGLTDGGWLQVFERGGLTDSASTTTTPVYEPEWSAYLRSGRERGRLGYPTSWSTAASGGTYQLFQRGAVAGVGGKVYVVYANCYAIWVGTGRWTGSLGFPLGDWTTGSGGGVQVFQKGAITDSGTTDPQVVVGPMWTAWRANGQGAGVLGYPVAAEASDARGSHQVFQGGELWALAGGTAFVVHGAVLDTWRADGAADGRYGYPLSDTTATPDGRLTCTFEGGTITA